MLHAGMKEIQAFSRVTFSQLTTCVSRGRICKSLRRRGRHDTAGVMALFTAHLVPWFHPARRPRSLRRSKNTDELGQDRRWK